MYDVISPTPGHPGCLFLSNKSHKYGTQLSERTPCSFANGPGISSVPSNADDYHGNDITKISQYKDVRGRS